MASGPLSCARCGHTARKPSPFCLMCGEPFPSAGPSSTPAPEPVETTFDRHNPLNQVKMWLLPAEELVAVFDCKGTTTGFVAITDQRILFYDKGITRKKKALTSVPFSRVTSVSSIDQGGVLRVSNELTIKVANEEFEFVFQRSDTAQRVYQLIMEGLLHSAS